MRKSIPPLPFTALTLLAIAAICAAASRAPTAAPTAAPAPQVSAPAPVAESVPARPSPPAAPAPQGAAPAQMAPGGPTPVAVIRLEGTIDEYSKKGLVKRFESAKAVGAKTIILDLDTWGGLVTPALEMSQYLKSQRDVRTVAYISSKAISAGAMVAMACDEIVMAPSAQIGDAAPIAVTAGNRVHSLGETERRKAEGPIVADFVDSAARNGYSEAMARAMVVLPASVHWLQSPTGERRVVDGPTAKELTAKGWAAVVDPDVSNPVDTESSLLTLTGRSAAKLGLAKAEAVSLPVLARDRNYNVIATYAPSTGETLVEWLNNPWIRSLLIVLFAISIWAALHAPGHGFAEVLAILALVLLLGVPLLTGYAQWWEIIVILVGVALLALEIFVIPGFGVTGILGIVMILFGLVMTFVGKEPGSDGVMPTMEQTWASVRTGLASVVGAMACTIVLAVWLRKMLPRMPYFGRLILTTVSGGDAPVTGSITTSRHEDGRFIPVVGAVGQAVSELRPGGSASFYDSSIADARVLSVISATGYIEAGSKVAVLENTDNRILVRAYEQPKG